MGRRTPQHDHTDRHHQVGNDGGHRNHGREFAPTSEKEQENERHQQVEPHRRTWNAVFRMDPAEHLGNRAVALHGIEHARGRRGIGAAGATGADECIRIKQQRQPIEIQGKGQLRERRTVFQRRPPLTQMIRRHGPQEGHLQHQVHHRTEGDGAENRERHAAAWIARLARQVHRILETVVAEYDAAGRDGRENRGQVADMGSAMYADMKVLRMKAAAHQGDRRGGGHNEFEERDGAIGVREYLHAPEVHQEIDHDQRGGNPQTRMTQFSLAIGGVHVQGMRPVPGP